jgi:hypothetical protein
MPIVINTPTSHIGRALATRLLDVGERVTLISRDRKKIEELAHRGARVGATFLMLAFAFQISSTAQDSTSLPIAKIFAPGIISGPANDGAPTFSADGKELFFGRCNNRWATILTSHFNGSHWSRPVPAPFAGPASDQQPAFSPDGHTLIFASSRPGRSGLGAHAVTHLWEVRRIGKTWSIPEELAGEVNISARVFKPSLAANGDLYFMADGGSGAPAAPRWQLYRAPLKDGHFQHAEPLPFSNGLCDDVDPAIAPDQSFLIFSSKGRAPMDDGHEHLFIVRHKQGVWDVPQPLRYQDDLSGADDGEAQISPDGHTLYFTSGRPAPYDKNRSRAQWLRDLEQLESWDNSNNNVWMILLPSM